MTRTHVYEKYHNVGWCNKKLALYQIPLSSSTAADRRSCTVARDPPADARSSIVTRCKRRQKCARLNFSRMNHRFRGIHWRWPPFCTPFRNTLYSTGRCGKRSASIRSEFSIYDPSQWNVRTSYITFCLISIHVRDRFAITGVYMNPGNWRLDLQHVLGIVNNSHEFWIFQRVNEHSTQFESVVWPIRCHTVNKIPIVHDV